MVGGESPSNGISQGKTQYGCTAPGVEARGSARGGGQSLSQGWRSGLEARARGGTPPKHPGTLRAEKVLFLTTKLAFLRLGFVSPLALGGAASENSGS